MSIEAHDHVLLAVHRGQRVSTVGIKSTLNWLSFSGFATPDTSAQEDDWTTHRLVPGPYAHNLFVEGEAATTNAPRQTILQTTAAIYPTCTNSWTRCIKRI